MWVNESRPGKDKALNVRGVLSYTSKPLVYNDGSGNITSVLSSLTQLDLMGGYTLGNFRLGVDIPVILRAEGGLPRGEEFNQGALGDVVLDAKYRFTGEKVLVFFRFAELFYDGEQHSCGDDLLLWKPNCS